MCTLFSLKDGGKALFKFPYWSPVNKSRHAGSRADEKTPSTSEKEQPPVDLLWNDFSGTISIPLLDQALLF